MGPLCRWEDVSALMQPHAHNARASFSNSDPPCHTRAHTCAHPHARCQLLVTGVAFPWGAVVGQSPTRSTPPKQPLPALGQGLHIFGIDGGAGSGALPTGTTPSGAPAALVASARAAGADAGLVGPAVTATVAGGGDAGGGGGVSGLSLRARLTMSPDAPLSVRQLPPPPQSPGFVLRPTEPGGVGGQVCASTLDAPSGLRSEYDSGGCVPAACVH